MFQVIYKKRDREKKKKKKKKKKKRGAISSWKKPVKIPMSDGKTTRCP